MKNIKLNYLNDKLKTGLSCLLVLTSLTGCVGKNASRQNSCQGDAYEPVSVVTYNSEKEVNSTYDSDKEVVELSLFNASAMKSLNYSDRAREEIESKCGNDRIVFSVCDENSCDYIRGIDYIVRDFSNKVIDTFTTDGDSHIISGLTIGETYTVEEVGIPDEYDSPCVYRFTMEEPSFEFRNGENPEDYYLYCGIKVTKEKISDQILKDEGCFKDSKFVVGAFELGEEYIDGVTFLVVNEDNELVDSWVSTKSSHVIYNVPDGVYTVRIVEPPMDYELVNVKGKSSDIFSEDVVDISYDVYIKDGEYMDGDYVDKSYWGPIFYFISSKEKVITDSNVVDKRNSYIRKREFK